MNGLEVWLAKKEEEIRFNIRRKYWARQLLQEAGFSRPGQKIRGEFEGIWFEIQIGPRGGVRIRETYPGASINGGS